MCSFSVEKLNAALELNRVPVGVRFLESEEDYLSATAKALTHKMPYCVMVKVAMAGVSIKANLEYMSCRGARNVLGLTAPLDSFLTGESGKNLGLYL